MARRYKAPEAERLEELLSDGEWHDGLTVVREAEKRITPGVAERRCEDDRARTAQKDENGKPVPRVKDVPLSTKIRIGKRSIMRSLVRARLRDGAFEIDPNPIPSDGWKAGGWKVRDLRVTRIAAMDVAKKLHTSIETLRDLLTQDPPIQVVHVGRVTYLRHEQIPELEERLEASREDLSQRRSAKSREVARLRREAPAQRLSLNQLADQCGLAHESCRQVRHTLAKDLPWKEVGRVTYLPIEHLPAWEAAVQQWDHERSQRRRLGQVKAVATRRQQAAGAEASEVSGQE